MLRLYEYIQEKWRLSAIGYVNQGSDERIAGRLGAFVQHLFSFHAARRQRIPYKILYRDVQVFVGNPPYIAINLPTPDKRFLHFRLGWRYDVNWPGYILSAALKFVDRPLIWK